MATTSDTAVSSDKSQSQYAKRTRDLITDLRALGCAVIMCILLMFEVLGLFSAQADPDLPRIMVTGKCQTPPSTESDRRPVGNQSAGKVKSRLITGIALA